MTLTFRLNGLEQVLSMNGVSFNWRKDGSPEIGLIAQDVEEVLPNLVVTNPNTGLKSVKYGNIVAPLIEASKSLYGMSVQNKRDIASLKDEQKDIKEKVLILEKENQDLRSEVDQMKAEMEEIKALLLKSK